MVLGERGIDYPNKLLDFDGIGDYPFGVAQYVMGDYNTCLLNQIHTTKVDSVKSLARL